MCTSRCQRTVRGAQRTQTTPQPDDDDDDDGDSRRPANNMLLQLFILANTFTCISSFSLQGFAVPKCKQCRFCHARGIRSRRFSTGTTYGYGGEARTTPSFTLNYDGKTYTDCSPPLMVPLSALPLLLLQSATPIISREDCALLSRYFEHLTGKCSNASSLGKSERTTAESLLQNVHNVIDTVTNCPRHDGEMQLPRYVRYETTILDTMKLKQNPKMLESVLFPDGLHVDTNNGKLFRHITAILYLTDNHEVGSSLESDGVSGGGTSFPLAVPVGRERVLNNKLRDAAKMLLNLGIHHTKGDIDENDTSGGRIVENAALSVFFRDEQQNEFNGLKQQCNFIESNSEGVRVMPEAGKLIYFHNVDDDGLPDPLSFHGGEELVTLTPYRVFADPSLMVAKATKCILVFFKEIPLESFVADGSLGFAKQAAKSRSWTKKMYY